jgi:hypothetical protein
MMNQGDTVTLTLHDTAHGLFAGLRDRNTGQTGSMTASAANGFGQIKFAPRGTSCEMIPYDFHPMYSTSSPRTRSTWTAHSYNVAFDDEIGHFDFCTNVDANNFACAKGASEGPVGDREPTDGDDLGCFPAYASTLVQVNGCEFTNVGFDGTSYHRTWPNGDRSMRPTPILFSSPTTGASFADQYQRVGFETDTPRIEASDFGGSCDRLTGEGCTLVPKTDDGTRATFYPWFSTGLSGGSCMWTIGQHVPGFSTNDYGGVSQYGQLLRLNYLLVPGAGIVKRFNDYRRVLSTNPCPRSS